MPRPTRCRRVCALPDQIEFGPAEPRCCGEAVVMTVDEYEAIRLIDLGGLTQEQCAAQMDVARTTITGIYDSARKKLADAIVNGRQLRIEGGSYRLCETGAPCPRHARHACPWRTARGEEHQVPAVPGRPETNTKENQPNE